MEAAIARAEGERVVSGAGTNEGAGGRVFVPDGADWVVQDSQGKVIGTGNKAEPWNAAPPAKQGKLTAEESLLREAVLRVIDDGDWSLYEGRDRRYIGENFANGQRLDFADAVIDTFRRFKVEER
jgi:hypothetical protein